MKHAHLILVACTAILALSISSALAIIPRAIDITPPHNARDVNPQLAEIRIAFDQPMDTTTYSITGGGTNFPTIVGTPRWVSDRVIVMQVQLEPSKEYRFGINGPAHQGFRNLNGEAAMPQIIVFRTADSPAATQPSDRRDRNLNAINTLLTALENDYSHVERLKIDWRKRAEDFRPRLLAARNGFEFAQVAVEFLAAAEDLHLWMDIEGQLFPTHRAAIVPNSKPERLPHILKNYQRRSRHVATGISPGGATVLVLNSLEADNGNTYPAAIDVIRAADPKRGLIIDLRGNTGGMERIAQLIAGCFIDEPIDYAKHRTRAGGQWQPMQTRRIEPNPDGPRYRGKVAVLIGPRVMSSSESMVQMFQVIPTATTIGGETRGSSGNPKPIDLGNGAKVHIPSWQSLTLDEQPIEGNGLAPRIAVQTKPTDFDTADPILTRADHWLAE